MCDDDDDGACVCVARWAARTLILFYSSSCIFIWLPFLAETPASAVVVVVWRPRACMHTHNNNNNNNNIHALKIM